MRPRLHLALVEAVASACESEPSDDATACEPTADEEVEARRLAIERRRSMSRHPAAGSGSNTATLASYRL